MLIHRTGRQKIQQGCRKVEQYNQLIGPKWYLGNTPSQLADYTFFSRAHETFKIDQLLGTTSLIFNSKLKTYKVWFLIIKVVTEKNEIWKITNYSKIITYLTHKSKMKFQEKFKNIVYWIKMDTVGNTSN